MCNNEYKCTCEEGGREEGLCCFASEMLTMEELENPTVVEDNICYCCSFCRDQCAQEV